MCIQNNSEHSGLLDLPEIIVLTHILDEQRPKEVLS